MNSNDDGSVLKTGDGELIMTGDNSYAGAMRVDGGTLRLGDATAVSAGTQLIVDNNATVGLGGSLITDSAAFRA